MKKYIFSGFLTVYLFTVFNVAAGDQIRANTTKK